LGISLSLSHSTKVKGGHVSNFLDEFNGLKVGASKKDNFLVGSLGVMIRHDKAYHDLLMEIPSNQLEGMTDGELGSAHFAHFGGTVQAITGVM